MGDHVEHVIMTTIEVYMSDEAMKILDYLVEKTGFTMDKVVEYSLANQIITEAMKDYKGDVTE